MELYMSDQTTLNIGSDLNLIHLIITRGLAVSIDFSDQYLRKGFPNSSTKDGFINYVNSLVTVLDAHHRLEDEIAFPGLKEKFPAAPYDLLEKQHEEIVMILKDIKKIINQMDITLKEPLKNLNSLLISLNELWHPHIKIEQEHFSDKNIARLINFEEQLKLSQKFAEFGRENSKPEYYIVPFMIFNTTKPNREFFYRHMPSIVTQQLVPGEWREKWTSMKPFLLEE
jgi:hemerythrin-like domain-containing protein